MIDMQSDIVLRAAQAADAWDLAGLRFASLVEMGLCTPPERERFLPRAASELFELLSQDRMAAWILIVDGVPAGCACTLFWNRLPYPSSSLHAEIAGVYVDPVAAPSRLCHRARAGSRSERARSRRSQDHAQSNRGRTFDLRKSGIQQRNAHGNSRGVIPRVVEGQEIMVAPFVRLDHLQLAIPAGGEGRARTFYVDIVGLEEMPKPAELKKRGGLWLRSGEIKVHLGVDKEFAPATKAHPAFRCADYDGCSNVLRHAPSPSCTTSSPSKAKRHCYVLDPFGNRIELIEN